MDFKDQIKQLSDRVIKLKDQIATEEATKNAFIMPFIQMLGLDMMYLTLLKLFPNMLLILELKKEKR